LDGDSFIVQVHGVFTRIRSGATAVALSLAAHSNLQRRRRALAAILAKIYSKWLHLRWVKNPNGFVFYL
jgi:hypothetical protein